MINASPAIWRLVLLKNDEYDDDEDGVVSDDDDDDDVVDGDDAGGGDILSMYVFFFIWLNFLLCSVCDVYLKYFLVQWNIKKLLLIINIEMISSSTRPVKTGIKRKLKNRNTSPILLESSSELDDDDDAVDAKYIKTFLENIYKKIVIIEKRITVIEKALILNQQPSYISW